jgi:hypothetical protein
MNRKQVGPLSSAANGKRPLVHAGINICAGEGHGHGAARDRQAPGQGSCKRNGTTRLHHQPGFHEGSAPGSLRLALGAPMNRDDLERALRILASTL